MTMKELEKGAEEQIEKAADEKIKGAPKDIGLKVAENVWGRVCAMGFKSEENQNRCKALERLPDIAQSGAKAIVACTATAAAVVGEGASDGLATPVALPVAIATAGSCAYNGASTIDNARAMGSQLYSGKEVKTVVELGEDAAGTWIKQAVPDEIDSQIREAKMREFRHVQAQNDGMTAQDYSRMQDALDDPF
jgi:hypothetical protein